MSGIKTDHFFSKRVVTDQDKVAKIKFPQATSLDEAREIQALKNDLFIESSVNDLIWAKVGKVNSEFEGLREDLMGYNNNPAFDLNKSDDVVAVVGLDLKSNNRPLDAFVTNDSMIVEYEWKTFNETRTDETFTQQKTGLIESCLGEGSQYEFSGAIMIEENLQDGYITYTEKGKKFWA